MRGANMRDAKGYICGPQRSDGYRFDLCWLDGAWRVVAGCMTGKNWTIDQYRDHASQYVDPVKEVETNLILDFLEARIAQVPECK
jgi:hypothetical protein